MNMDGQKLERIVFLTKETDVAGAKRVNEELCAEFTESKVDIRTEVKLVKGNEIDGGPLSCHLYVANSPELYRIAESLGYPVIGCILGDTQKEKDFSGCPYLISDPQWIDADSYEKIYQRIVGIPWTILETKRCCIREMTIDDLDGLYQLYDDTARQFLTPPSENREEERELLRAYIENVYGMLGYGYWAVIDKESGQFCGRVGFSVCDGDEPAMIGYMIRKDFRRKGYAREVVHAIVEYAQEYLPFEKGIGAVTHHNNTASIALLEELGFQKIGDNDDQRTLFIYAGT